MTLLVDHIEADCLAGTPILGMRRKVEHEALLNADIDTIMTFLRQKIEGANVVRILWTESNRTDAVATPEETEDAFQGRFGGHETATVERNGVCYALK